MKRSVNILLAAALTGFASLASAQSKVGVVNTDRLLQESPQFLQAQDEIKAEFAPRQREIQALGDLAKSREDALQRDGATMTDMQRASKERELQSTSTELRRMQTNAEEDFNARRDDVMAKLQRILKAEIEAYAKANGYDLILVSGVGYHAPSYDVTGPLLEAMKKKAGVAATPAAAPAAAAKPPATAPAAAKPPVTPAAKPPTTPAAKP